MPSVPDHLPLPRHPAPEWAPEPPVEPPPGGLVRVPGRGEFFLRDSGGDGTPVVLLHAWMFPSDLNWFRCYDPLVHAGYRVLAIDHRGHGRGLRTHEPAVAADGEVFAALLVRAVRDLDGRTNQGAAGATAQPAASAASPRSRSQVATTTSPRAILDTDARWTAS